MVLDITALEVSLHNNLETELEADRQKNEGNGKHHTHHRHQPKSFLGKTWDGLKSATKNTFTKENLAWAGMVFVASIAASLGAFGVTSLIGETGLQAFAEFANSSVPFVDGMDIAKANGTIKMLGVAALLPITFGFARAFRDGYGENDRQAQKHQHKEHEKGRGKVREHAQGHANQHTQTRDQERVNGTVAPIPVLATAARQEPAAPHAHTNASERPAYLQNILAQGPNSQNRSHVAALEAEQAVAGSRGV